MIDFSEMMPSAWWQALLKQMPPEAVHAVEAALSREYEAGCRVFPPLDRIFAALELTPLDQVKAVILGQDPYPGEGEAHGLAFSVPAGVGIPRSLRNIFQEREADLGLAPPRSGDLSAWARQGVLLLNTVLTVRAGQRDSHSGLGWQELTRALVRAVSSHHRHVVFMLWGRPAQALKPWIADPGAHCVLESSHPSPLSVARGFRGCRHFSRANAYRTSLGLPGVDWGL